MPQISIIVPVYKVEKYLKKCIDSILCQTFSNLELILVDDGSPDRCGIICDEYAKQDQRVKVIHKKNGGLSSARNAGIEIARGEYIGFVDSDDWIDEDMYELLYTMAKKYHAEIVECSYRNITADGIVEETENTGEIIEADNIFALRAQLEWKYFKSVAVNKLYHKNIFADGKRYPEGKTHEDEFFTHAAFYAANKLIYVDQSKYNYLRTREDSITGRPFNYKGLDACEAYFERFHFFREHKLETLMGEMEAACQWTFKDRLGKALDVIEYDFHSEESYAMRRRLLQLIGQYSEEVQKFLNRRDKVRIYFLRNIYWFYKLYKNRNKAGYKH